ncbi:hypothetical protein HDV04_003943 [Boothiomyces sp. JEL0838]|nr:hypothetical protein HDV04_003943 [Boothiomyces sp. JEL0838]
MPFLLTALVAGAILVENQYFEKKCVGPPNTIYAFSVSNPFAYDPSLNETWPSFFRFHFEEFSVGDTDNCYTPIAGTACTSSLRQDLSFPYSSGSTSWFPNLQNISTVVSQAANGYTYCMIYANDFDSPKDLFGFKAILFRSDDNCYDEHFKCGSNGTFSFYESRGCNEIPAIAVDIHKEISIDSVYFGNVTLRMETFSNAAMYYDWIQFSPTADLVPRFDMPWDYISAFLYCISLILALYIPIHTIYRLRIKKLELKVMHYIVISSQLCMFLWIAMSLIFWLLIFEDNEQLAIFAEFRDIFLNIGTLLSSISTGILYVTAICNCQSLITIHIALDGPNYLLYFYNGGDNNIFYSGDSSIISSVTTWENLGYLWVISLFAWNFAVPMIICLKCLELKSENLTYIKRFGVILSADPQLPYLFAIQLFSVIGYSFMSYVLFSTSWLGSNMGFQDGKAVGIFFMMLNVSFSLRINESVQRVFQVKIATKANETSSITQRKFGGPPNTIYIFDVSNPFSYDPTLNETWPSFFRFHFSDLTVGDTDNCYVPIKGTACTSSLLPIESYPYKSGSTSWYQGMDSMDKVVASSANSNLYCQLSAANFNDSSSLFGYKAIYFLADELQCYDNHFRCKENGQFSYYEENNCSGVAAISLNNTFVHQHINYFGNISFELTNFTNAAMIYDWFQYTPSTYLVPHFTIAWDYIGLVFFLFAILLAFYIPANTVGRFLSKKKTINPARSIVIISQILLFLWVLLGMIFWLTVFLEAETMAIFAECRESFFNIGTLMSAISAGVLLVKAIFKGNM